MASASYLATVPTHSPLTPSPKKETLGTSSEQVTPSHDLTSSPSLKPTISAVRLQANPNRLVYVGMWTQGMWNDQQQLFHKEALSQLESQIGKKVAIAHFYTGWENLSRDNFVNQLNSISSNGWVPMISINPYFTTSCQANGKTLYQAISSGNCDSLLHSIGHTLSLFKQPLFLRFAWEMNIESMDWSIQKAGGTPADYIAAWRRFHDIAVSEGARSIIWVFSPNTSTSTSIPFNELYPGDSYVDWVALDGYNWGTTKSWSSWQSFSTVFSSSYYLLHQLAPTKPMMLAEVNTTEQGGNKADWYKDMLTVQIPNNFPHIQAIVIYNEDRTNTEQVNWLISSSPQSLSAFKEAIQLPFYRSTFPAQ